MPPKKGKAPKPPKLSKEQAAALSALAAATAATENTDAVLLVALEAALSAAADVELPGVHEAAVEPIAAADARAAELREREAVRLRVAPQVKTYRANAEEGDVDAAALLATAYSEGFGVCPDPAESDRYLRAAADGGDAEACYRLSSAIADAEPTLSRTWAGRAHDGGCISGTAALYDDERHIQDLSKDEFKYRPKPKAPPPPPAPYGGVDSAATIAHRATLAAGGDGPEVQRARMQLAFALSTGEGVGVRDVTAAAKLWAAVAKDKDKAAAEVAHANIGGDAYRTGRPATAYEHLIEASRPTKQHRRAGGRSDLPSTFLLTGMSSLTRPHQGTLRWRTLRRTHGIIEEGVDRPYPIVPSRAV